jgi:hypothetical protein
MIIPDVVLTDKVASFSLGHLPNLFGQGHGLNDGLYGTPCRVFLFDDGLGGVAGDQDQNG